MTFCCVMAAVNLTRAYFPFVTDVGSLFLSIYTSPIYDLLYRVCSAVTSLILTHGNLSSEAVIAC